jgi:hypothetical protein
MTDDYPRTRQDWTALERRLETLELTLGELVAIHRRIEEHLAASILFKPRF